MPAGQPATQLRVTFVNPLTSLPTPIQVSIAGGDRIPVLQTTAVAATEDPDTVLVTLAGGGDLSTYTLSLVRTEAPSSPSSTKATRRTPASTTITVGADRGRGLVERDRATGSGSGAVQDLVQRRRSSLLDETRQQVLLKRLVGLGCAATEHSMGLFWNMLDLNTRHGAILALRAPHRKSVG